MAFNRSAGVILNVSSLPGPFGIGVMGKEARDWIDLLAEMGFHFWQVLPLTSVDPYHSPYTSCSAFAGNPLYIDPRGLCRMGFIRESEGESCVYHGSPYTADYDFAERTRMALLRKAFDNAGSGGRDLGLAFASEHPWAEDYALYMAVCGANPGLSWREWKPSEADYRQCVAHQEPFAGEKAFWLFVQAVFFSQWRELRGYAAERGIRILGDMPIYVSYDSADVWSRRELFCLNGRDFRPDKVAGVPPDYFAQDGQLWGNPLYDWNAMRDDGYRWWCDRLREALKLYDWVKIDHFRALASYWAIPAGAKTAKEGSWEKGPGMSLIRALRRETAVEDELPIVAEDLGVFGKDVEQLLEESGLPGMRVIQFGLDADLGSNSSHLPHNYPVNTVAYTGTHDNNTLLGWLWETGEEQRRFAMDYCGFHGANWGEGGYHSPSCRAVIETLWRSPAQCAVLPFQDMCGFGGDTRMNVPGVQDGNWLFRATEENMRLIDRDYFRHINRLFSR